MQRSILRQKIRARLASTEILIRGYSNQIFNEKGFEITPEQYTILSLIIDNKELYQRQLSEITLKDRANISRIINILEEKALVERVIGSNGRQIFKIKPTRKGIELDKQIAPVTKEIRQTLTKGIANEALETCLDTLDRIFLNLREKANLQI